MVGCHSGRFGDLAGHDLVSSGPEATTTRLWSVAT